MEQTECSETSAYTIQTPGNYPEESIQQEHGTPRKTKTRNMKLINPFCVTQISRIGEAKPSPKIHHGNFFI